MKTVPLGPDEQQSLPPGEGGEGMGTGDPMMAMANPGGAPGNPMMGAGQPVKLTDPSMTARVVKAWMSED